MINIKKKTIKNLIKDKIQYDLLWDKTYQDALNGNIDKEKLAFAMGKCNQVDQQLSEEKHKILFSRAVKWK